MEDRPARVDDLRGLRRWLLVVAVWATAATAIAVFALIAATEARDDNTEAGRQSARTAGQIAQAQRRLDRRLDELESRVGELPGADEVSGLSNRLERLEGATSQSSDELEELSGSVDDLDTRVESLEEEPSNSAEGTETTP